MNDETMRYAIFANHVASTVLALYITQNEFREQVDNILNDGAYFSISGNKMSEYENAEMKLMMSLTQFSKGIAEEWFSEDDEEDMGETDGE